MEKRGMSASGGLPIKIHGQDGRATTGVWQANSLPNAMKLSIIMDVTEYCPRVGQAKPTEAEIF